MAYTYNILTEDIKKLKEKFPDIPVFSIGKSVEGRELFALKAGIGRKKIFLNGAHHGMEWLTAKVLIAFAEELAENPPTATSFYIVPMVNPDGVEIAAAGSRWQANARGVDLNHNYDALWALSKKAEQEHGIFQPGPTRFGGEYPESEPESRAVADFTRQNDFDAAIALHSQGEVIYYDFCGCVPDGTEEYLNKFEACSNYRRDTPMGIASYGGYKDWFIKKFKKPAFTIEIGLGENPLTLDMFDDVYSGVLPVLRSLV